MNLNTNKIFFLALNPQGPISKGYYPHGTLMNFTLSNLTKKGSKASLDLKESS